MCKKCTRLQQWGDDIVDGNGWRKRCYANPIVIVVSSSLLLRVVAGPPPVSEQIESDHNGAKIGCLAKDFICIEFLCDNYFSV